MKLSEIKRLIWLILGITIFASPTGAKEYVVIDSIDGGPIIGATVFGRSGVIKGLTGNGGCIVVDERDIPLTIRFVGYEPILTTPVNDTIRMCPTSYHLNEVVITPVDRPIKRILCFAREYSSGITGKDTMQYYCEYMAEAFIADGKVKGYKKSDARPTPKNHRRFARIVREGRDSVFQPSGEDDITELSWFSFMAFIPQVENVPEVLRNGCEADTVPGKYGPKFIYRRKNGFYTKTADVLSDHKDRKWSPFIFKLLGITADIEAGTWTMTFADNGDGVLEVSDFICGVYNIHLTGRGKWLKKVFETRLPIELDAYLELYPVETSNCTIEDYKGLRDDFGRIRFRYPDNIEPLSPAIENFIGRAVISNEARQEP